jgi:7-keto-8-aminopelargonate synthetase-like enzyme
MRTSPFSIHQLITNTATIVSSSPQRHDLAPVEFSNDYCKLPESPSRSFLSSNHTSSLPPVTFHSSGCGGCHLLVHNHAHAALEASRQAHFPPFRCLPLQVRFRQQHGFLRVHTTVNDALLHDKAINTSVHDGLSTPRITPRARLPFAHNDVSAFHFMLCATLKESKSTCSALSRQHV